MSTSTNHSATQNSVPDKQNEVNERKRSRDSSPDSGLAKIPRSRPSRFDRSNQTNLSTAAQPTVTTESVAKGQALFQALLNSAKPKSSQPHVQDAGKQSISTQVSVQNMGSVEPIIITDGGTKSLPRISSETACQPPLNSLLEMLHSIPPEKCGFSTYLAVTPSLRVNENTELAMKNLQKNLHGDSTYYPSIYGCRSVNAYRWLNKIDEGSFGVVHRAEDKITKRPVAIKRIRMKAEHGSGRFFPITSLREYGLLKRLNSPNIIKAYEIVVKPRETETETKSQSHHLNDDETFRPKIDSEDELEVYMVMEYCNYDLKSYLRSLDSALHGSEVKKLLYDLLIAVRDMHRVNIMHRDLKASNILLQDNPTSGLTLKVADLGSSRIYSNLVEKYTCPVVTLWYRSPELLRSGDVQQAGFVDMWSVGCIFAEMVISKPLFQGKTEIAQYNAIFDLLAPKTPMGGRDGMLYSATQGANARSELYENELPTYSALRSLIPSETYDGRRALSKNGFELLSMMLHLNPMKRITAEQALMHPYFAENPFPCDRKSLPKPTASNEDPEARERARQLVDDFGERNIDTIYEKERTHDYEDVHDSPTIDPMEFFN